MPFLTSVHQTLLEQDSAIPAAVHAERPYQSLTASDTFSLLPKLRFSLIQARLGSGLLFPLTLPSDPAPLYQFRPDQPRQDADGKPIKYELPPKIIPRLIFHARATDALAQGTAPIYITEGARKLDALIGQGAVAAGVIGVWSFAVPRTAKEQRRGAPKVLLPDWQCLALPGRSVVLCFDSDAAQNPNVAEAEQDLARLLRAQGAQVTRVRLPSAPGGIKQGIDDFFASGNTLADMVALIEPLPRVHFDTISAPDLYHKTLPPARWVIPGKLPVGATLFVGRSKDGKSFMAWDLAIATATGGKALGIYEVDQGDVLYLALEDGERRGQQRLEDQMAHVAMTEPPSRLRLVFWRAPRLGEGFLERLDTWADEHPDGRLVIVDILEKIRPPRTKDGMYADDYRALEALQQFAQQRNVAVLVVHHSNKTKPDDFRDAASGSMALTGACDTLWSLHRMAGEPDATLKMLGREIESQELALQFHDGFWSVLGPAAPYRLSKESREILDLLTTAGRPLTPKEIAHQLTLAVGIVRARLRRMLARGELRHTDAGYLPAPPPASLDLSPKTEAGDPTPPPPSPLDLSLEDVTPVTPVTDVTPVTPVTLEQKGPELHPPIPPNVTLFDVVTPNDSMSFAPETLEQNGPELHPVTPPPVTLFESVTPNDTISYKDDMASVTGVTPHYASTHDRSKDTGLSSLQAPCYLCHHTQYWVGDQGQPICAICHPNPDMKEI